MYRDGADRMGPEQVSRVRRGPLRAAAREAVGLWGDKKVIEAKKKKASSQQ